MPKKLKMSLTPFCPLPTVATAMSGKPPKRVIVVPDRIVNVVV